MNLPEFTADASLYRTGGRYRTSGSDSGGRPPGEVIVPAAGEWAGRIGTGLTWTDVGAKPWAGPLDGIGGGMSWSTCDAIGKPCCGPDAEVKTPHCHKGLGCNVATGQCDACGGPGQVCCDGHFTGFSQKGYTGVLLDPVERIATCDAGASCDASLAADGVTWTGTRRCQPCGTKAGYSCCKADISYGLGHCFRDEATGDRLVCSNPWQGVKGICTVCGGGNQRACMTPGEYPCGDRLVEQDGFCRHCGTAGHPACDGVEPCPDPDSVPNKNFTWCLHAGGPNQPCRRDGSCTYKGLICNQKSICEQCGSPGQICCPPSTGLGPCYANTAAECRDGRCFACGFENMPVCPTGALCRDDSEPYFGWCRHCGNEGEVCCKSQSIKCNSPLKCKDGVCQRPPASGGGGGGGATVLTCSGKPYTFGLTSWHDVAIEDAHGCHAWLPKIFADNRAEALQCARAKYGNAVIDTLEDFDFAVTCPSGCVEKKHRGRNHDATESCMQYLHPGCSITDGDCP
jgi:hypothetical protein